MSQYMQIIGCVFSSLVMLGLVSTGIYFFITRVAVRSYVGHKAYLFLRNNNNYLTLSLIILLGLTGYAYYYGFGEPILTSSLNETIDLAKKNNPETVSNISKIKNTLLYGQKALSSDNDINLQKAYFKTLVKDYPIIDTKEWKKKNPSDENNKQLLENSRNHLRYGLFASNDEITKLRNAIPPIFVKKYHDDEKDLSIELIKEKKEKKSWQPVLSVIFWFFVCVLVAVIVSRDEVADGIEAFIDYIKKMRKEVVNVEITKSTSSNESANKPQDKNDDTISSKLGWFTRLYSSDMAAEFTIKLFEKFITFFRR